MPLTSDPIEDLIAAATSGDPRAWDTIVDRFGALVWSVIRGHGLYGAEAADVSQTTWLRLVEHLDRIREPERLAAWLATTARRECRKVLKAGRRLDVVDDVPELPAVGSDAIDHALLRDEDRSLVAAAFVRIPSRCQVLLRLLVADPPISYDDIASILEMPKGSIGPTRGRCLNHLRDVLEAS